PPPDRRRGRAGAAGRRAGRGAARARDRSRLEAAGAPRRAHPVSDRAGGSVSVRRLGAPRPVAVRRDADGAPAALRGRPVEAILEDWVVEDRWWTGRPLRRRYFEIVLGDGRNTVVFRDLVAGGWF